MLNFKIDSRRAAILLDDLGDKARDLTPAFTNFHAYMLRRTALMFVRLKKGGEFRGEKWEYFSPQYTRKTDNVTVPAWGGVPRLRAGYSARKLRGGFVRGAYSRLDTGRLAGQRKTKGPVRGRRRHSGKRVTPGSSMMADTGRLRNAALTLVQIRRGTVLQMDTPLPYASFLQRRRPFQFFEVPQDVDVLRRMILKYWVGS